MVGTCQSAEKSSLIANIYWNCERDNILNDISREFQLCHICDRTYSVHFIKSNMYLNLRFLDKLVVNEYH
jgi:hypothetical protein